MSSTDFEVRIKGRNDLTLAVKQAEQQLKGLMKQGELLGKVLRGGAIAGAFVAFERLAEKAQEAAEAIGDKGTAQALRQLNREIDALKNKGTNLIGTVLGNVYSAFSSDRMLQLREQVDFLRRMQGRSFVAVGYDDIGTGFFTAAEGAAKLLELEKKLALYESSRPYGSRDRAPGGQGGRGRNVFIPEATTAAAGTAGKAEQFSAEFLAYIEGLERAGEAQQHFEDTLAGADKAIRDNFSETLDRNIEQLERIPSVVQEAASQMTVFAEQAGRNMQTAFADFLFDPFKDGLKGMAAGFVDMIRRMVAELAAQQILRMFFEWGSGLGGGVGKFFGSMLDGVRASGGPVRGGGAYMVGERGPELFVPGTSGTIVPNHAMGGVTVNYTIDARGADAERIMAMLPPMLKQTEERTISRVRDLSARGRM